MKNQAKSGTNITIWRRQQVVTLREKDYSFQEIAKITGFCDRYVRTIWNLWKTEGNITPKKKGHRGNAYLTTKQELDFLEEIKSLQLVTGEQVRQKAMKKFGFNVSKDWGTKLLKRHAWSKKKPRPTHPKTDKKAQEDFKKNGQNK